MDNRSTGWFDKRRIDLSGGRQAPRRAGLTLVEILVATTITLLMMAAVVQIFAMIGQNVTNARAMLELDSQLRHAAAMLQEDLDRIVAPRPVLWAISHDHRFLQQDLEGIILPHQAESKGLGYYKYTEKGTSDQLEITARYAVFPDGLLAAPPALIRWEVTTTDGRGQLRRWVQSLDTGASHTGAVLDHVTKFDIQAYNPLTGTYQDYNYPSTGNVFDSSQWFRQWLVLVQWQQNGFDDDGDGLVDEQGEKDGTTPDLPPPVSGIRITIGVEDPDTQQEREVTLVHHFTAR